MTLTPEERRRIYEEERPRMRVCSEPWKKAFVVLVAATALTANTMARNSKTATPSPTKSPTPGVWTQEPTTYRGVEFGATIMEARAQDRGDKQAAAPDWIRYDNLELCSTDPRRDRYGQKVRRNYKLSSETCKSFGFIGGVGVEEFWLFKNDANYENGALVTVSLSFRSSAYADLRDVFIDKFGPPHHVQIGTLKTRMNVEVENETLMWKGVNVFVSLSRYDDKITEGGAVFAPIAYLEESVKKRAEEKKKAKDAF